MSVGAHSLPQTFADRLVPDRRLAVQIGLVLGGSLLLALLSQISMPLFFTPVPITGQTFGVLLIGALLGSRRGVLAVGAYLAEAALGLPFLAGGVSGLPVGPLGGYLIGFLLMAFVVGLLCERHFDRTIARAALAMVVGEAALFAVALPWLSRFVGTTHVVALGMLPFLPGELAKIVLVALLLPTGWRLLGNGRAEG